MYHLSFFLGIPLCGPLGMSFTDKVIFKSAGHYVWRIVAGFITGISGSAFIYWVLPFWGVEVFNNFLPPISGIYIAGGMELILLISTFFSLIGYNAAGLFKRDRKNLLVN
jgi:hypothetical protein